MESIRQLLHSESMERFKILSLLMQFETALKQKDFKNRKTFYDENCYI